MKLLSEELTKNLREFTSEFLKGVWDGMGPDIRRKPIRPSKPIKKVKR